MEDLASAAYFCQAGDFALKRGYLGALTEVLGALGKGLTANDRLMDVTNDPTRVGSLY